MKIIFFGTPEFVIPVAKSLRENFDTAKERALVAVVTQPPRPSGRDQKITYSAVDTWAYKHKLPIIRNFQEEDLPEADLGVVAAYGQIIPDYVIKHFKYGILNIHPSLLPKYRGASPIQNAIKDGLTTTGLTVIKMDEKMDHGPIVSSFKEEVAENDTSETLTKRIFERASEFIIDLIPNYIAGKIKLKPQDESQVTFTKVLKKEDGFIEFEKLTTGDPVEVYNFIRAMHPWPVAWTLLRQGSAGQAHKKLKILKSHLTEVNGHKILVLDEVKLEGKNAVTFTQFKAGHPEVDFGKIL